ncbi:MAG: dienelactone hydrolase family protein [Sphingomonadaceae bacterium]|nr:dienelactone hydrolase family protein [Sphingomonadaceae bacterium]
MTAVKRAIESRHGEVELESFLLADPDAGERPLVMIFPNIFGLDEVDEENAQRIVGLGYAAFACDLYGKGRRTGDREVARPWMMALLGDRPLLQDRILHLLEVARGLPEVDGGKAAAIGFCFGGLCVLDFARTGADIAGVASFHGLFTPPPNIAEPKIKARVAVYHGWEDALVPPEQVVALGQELTGAGCDWQIHCFGGAVHGFTHARPPEEGIAYNALADKRAWRAAEGFLEECFG